MKDHVVIDDSLTTASGNTGMLDSLVPLRTTTMSMHRIWFEISTLEQWYSVIRDANRMFGHKNWAGQGHVRRKLERMGYLGPESLQVWFDVPDERFGTWVSIKHAVRMTKIVHK